MNGRQQGLRVRAFGFFLGAVLLSAVGTVAARNRNTAYGSGALQNSNITGSGNVASGVQALFSNAAGLRNTAVGTIALYNHTTGHSNTALGYQGWLQCHYRK